MSNSVFYGTKARLIAIDFFIEFVDIIRDYIYEGNEIPQSINAFKGGEKWFSDTVFSRCFSLKEAVDLITELNYCQSEEDAIIMKATYTFGNALNLAVGIIAKRLNDKNWLALVLKEGQAILQDIKEGVASPQEFVNQVLYIQANKKYEFEYGIKDAIKHQLLDEFAKIRSSLLSNC